MAVDDEALRVAVYDALARTGRAPSLPELALAFSADEPEVRACVDAWLAEAGVAKGYVMDLATLWRFASHWYDGRLTYGYVRRDPATAQQYVLDCGLVGPFWGV